RRGGGARGGRRLRDQRAGLLAVAVEGDGHPVAGGDTGPPQYLGAHLHRGGAVGGGQRHGGLRVRRDQQDLPLPVGRRGGGGQGGVGADPRRFRHPAHPGTTSCLKSLIELHTCSWPSPPTWAWSSRSVAPAARIRSTAAREPATSSMTTMRCRPSTSSASSGGMPAASWPRTRWVACRAS